MEVLMLRLDVFDHIHQYLLDFWKEIVYTFSDDDAIVFTTSFASYDDIARKISPELYLLCESYVNMQGTLSDLGDAQREILRELKYIPGKSISKADAKAQILSFLSCSSVSEGFALRRNEYYEIEESKKLILHDIEKLESVIKKEMKKFWNRIDTLIIYSYKQLLYNITGSIKFAEAFMNEMLRHVPVKKIGIAKRNCDYELLIEICYQLDGCIGDWVVDIEQLVGAPQ